jgi:hypothetical protein
MWHRIELLQNMPEVDVLGFFDDDPDIASALEERVGFRRFDVLEDLLALRPELGIIESMGGKTPEFARAAAPYSKALLLEKVSAPSLPQLESLSADL